MEKGTLTLSSAERELVEQFAQKLLSYYEIKTPPIAVETIAIHPPTPLESLSPVETSFVMGYGLYKNEPRLALARLIYRRILEVPQALDALKWDEALPASSLAVRAFARALLLPREWLPAYWKQTPDPEALATLFAVPSHAVLIRLEELGLYLPHTSQPES